MSKKLMDKKNISIVVIAVVSAYLLYMLVNMVIGCMDTYPREYRDTANVALATYISEGNNPYAISEDGELPPIYVYTPLNVVVVAAIMNVVDVAAYHIFYWIDLIYICLIALVIYKMVAKETGSKLLGYVSTAPAITLGYRYDFIQASPDRLGILVLVLALYIAGNYKGKYRIELLSLVTALSFYAKQYFLVIAVPVFFYVLICNWKDAMKYFLYTAILGFGSLFIIHQFYPMFTMETILFLGVEMAETTDYDRWYTIMQFKEFLKRYCFLLIPILLYYASYILTLLKVKPMKKLQTLVRLDWFEHAKEYYNVHFFTVFIMALVLLRIGQNTGAYLSYHLSLLGPSFVVLGFMGIKLFGDKVKEGFWRNGFYLLVGITVAFICNHFYEVVNKTPEQIQEFERAYEMIEEYNELGDSVYLDPTLAYYAIDHDMPVYDCGHSSFIHGVADGIIRENIIDMTTEAKYFSAFPEFQTAAIAYKDNINDMVDNQEFGLIATMGDNIFGKDVSEQYELTDTVLLVMGTQKFEINLWERK